MKSTDVFSLAPMVLGFFNAFNWLPAFKEKERCHKIIQISDFS